MKFLFLFPIILFLEQVSAQNITIYSKGSGTPFHYARSMWNQTFIVGAWVTSTPPDSLSSDTTDVFMYEFSSVMKSDQLLNSNSYSIKDSNEAIIPIYEVAKLDSLDGLSATPGTTLIALVIPKADSGMVYQAAAYNLQRNDGMPIDTTKKQYYYHNWE